MATIKGVWVFKSSINLAGVVTQSVKFSCNGVQYDAMCFLTATQGFYIHYGVNGSFTDPNSIYGAFALGVWGEDAYRTVDFGSTPQEVSSRYYELLIANAIPEQAEPTTHYYYNGVKLPKIPIEVLVEYPYRWIRKNTTSGYYDLVFTKVIGYYDPSAGTNAGIVYNTSDKMTDCLHYRISIANADSATEWGYYQLTKTWYGIDTNRTVLWSNHDIPNGSATATSIYFKGSEPEEPKTIKGKWVFNDELDTSARFEQGVNCVRVSDGHQLYGFTSYYSDSWGKELVSVYTNSSLKSRGIIFHSDSIGWDGNYAINSQWDFGTTEQEVSDTFLTWMQANATQIIETTPTTITYNGTELASLEEGQTANFDCNGKKAVGAVSILFGSKGSITYKGVTTEIEKGKTANLLCSGKKFGSDVVVAVEKAMQTNFTLSDGSVYVTSDGNMFIAKEA
jgi:hypothetical protein